MRPTKIPANHYLAGDTRIAIDGAVSLQKCGLTEQEDALSRLFDEPVRLQTEFGQPGLIPWRLPIEDVLLFPDDMFRREAIKAGGARLRFHTDATEVTIHGAKVASGHRACPGDFLDLCIDNALIATAELADNRAVFSNLPAGRKVLEVWLCPAFAFAFNALSLNPGASLLPLPVDERPRWIVYGSSHTLAVRAHSPAQTWPAVVARKRNWNLLCLGYGGQCKIDPMIARMIRDSKADVISLELGANCCDGTFSPRSFPAAVIGTIMTIRERHPDTPIILSSPIHMARCEQTPGPTGLTTPLVRSQIAEIFDILRHRGDSHLHLINGLDLFDASHPDQQPDGSHPNGDGNLMLAKNYLATLSQTLT